MAPRMAVASRSRFDILQQDETEQSDTEDESKPEIESTASSPAVDMTCAIFFEFVHVPLTDQQAAFIAPRL